MELHEIVEKLTGPVVPIGKTEVDAERYENLEELITLTSELVSLLSGIEHLYAGRVEASLKKAGLRCREFFMDVGIL